MKLALRSFVGAVCAAFAAALLLVGAGTARAVASPTVIYVTNSTAGTVSVVDAATDKVTATINVGAKPWSVAVSPDGLTAYVSNSGGNDVSVIDTRTDKVRATVVVGTRPCDLRVSPDGRFVYVDVFVTNVVAVIDTQSDKVVRTIAVGGVNPYGMAMSANGDTLYTANVDGTDNAASTVSVIDLRTDTLTAVIKGFNGSEDVAVNAAGDTAYAPSITSNALSVIDAHTNLVTRSVALGNGPQGVVVSPDGASVYLADSGTDTVTQVNAATLAVTRSVQVGVTPAELALSADGEHLYVTNFDAGTMSDVDTATGVVLATVAVGAGPHGVAVGPLESAATQVGSIAGSLPRPQDAFSSPTTVVVSAAVAIGGTFFLTFPAQLFNLTFHENYDVLRAWWLGLPDRLRRKSKRKVRPKDPSGSSRTSDAATPPSDADIAPAAAVLSDATSALPLAAPLTPAATPPSVGHEATSKEPSGLRETGPVHERRKFALVVLVGALFGALLDPRFGFNSRTAESYVAIVATVIVGAVVPALVTAAYHRAKAGAAPYHLEALPGGLIIAAACVLVSRLAGFQPGYLYGVVAGIAFTRVLGKQQKGHVIALSTLTTLTVAVVAWLAWVPIDRIAEKPGAFAGLVVADDFLGSMFVGGLVGTVIGLLPLQFLPGWALKEWHRGVWALLFALASFGVVDVLMLSHHKHSGRASSIVTTVVLFVIFAGGSVVFREYFIRKRRALSGGSPTNFRAWLRELIEPAPPAVARPAEADGDGA